MYIVPRNRFYFSCGSSSNIKKQRKNLKIVRTLQLIYEKIYKKLKNQNFLYKGKREYKKKTNV